VFDDKAGVCHWHSFDSVDARVVNCMSVNFERQNAEDYSESISLKFLRSTLLMPGHYFPLYDRQNCSVY
jgi:hypothetical protein